MVWSHTSIFYRWCELVGAIEMIGGMEMVRSGMRFFPYQVQIQIRKVWLFLYSYQFLIGWNILPQIHIQRGSDILVWFNISILPYFCMNLSCVLILFFFIKKRVKSRKLFVSTNIFI
jgi:hypothetical protein